MGMEQGAAGTLGSSRIGKLVYVPDGSTSTPTEQVRGTLQKVSHERDGYGNLQTSLTIEVFDTSVEITVSSGLLVQYAAGM